MRPLEFRQPVYVDGKLSHFHYWGYIKGDTEAFIGPTNLEKSDQLIGDIFRNGAKVYEGDIIHDEAGAEAVIYWNPDLLCFACTKDRVILNKNSRVVGNIRYENPESYLKKIDPDGILN